MVNRIEAIGKDRMSPIKLFTRVYSIVIVASRRHNNRVYYVTTYIYIFLRETPEPFRQYPKGVLIQLILSQGQLQPYEFLRLKESLIASERAASQTIENALERHRSGVAASPPFFMSDRGHLCR